MSALTPSNIQTVWSKSPKSLREMLQRERIGIDAYMYDARDCEHTSELAKQIDDELFR